MEMTEPLVGTAAMGKKDVGVALLAWDLARYDVLTPKNLHDAQPRVALKKRGRDTCLAWSRR